MTPSILLHVPGESGGWVVSRKPQQAPTCPPATYVIETDSIDLAQAHASTMRNNAMYLGIYSIDEDDLLFRN